jgi:cytochrome c oxidase subunit 3
VRGQWYNAVVLGTPAITAGRSPLAVGFMIWLGSELMFFAGLFATFITLAAENDTWPPADVELETGRTAIFTVVLLTSSVTVHLAVHAADHLDRRAAGAWLAATVALGAVFLVNQGLEYTELEFWIDDHAYGTIFYLLTGFHGLHVAGGLVLLGLLTRDVVSDATVRSTEHIRIGSWYWHFVDVVWIGVFLLVYVL